jgi:hypothetical protein
MRLAPLRCTPLRAAAVLVKPSAARACAPPLSRPSRAAAAAAAAPARLHRARARLSAAMASAPASASASAPPPVSSVSASAAALRDPSSLSNPRAVRITHADLVLAVDFPARRVAGSAALRVRIENGDAAAELILDTRDLSVTAATWHGAGGDDDDVAAPGAPLAFALDAPVGALGAALRVSLPAGLRSGDVGVVTLTYATSPASSACQWLTPEQARDVAMRDAAARAWQACRR